MRYFPETMIAYAVVVAFFLMDFVLRRNKVAASIHQTKDDKNSTNVIILTFLAILAAAELLGYFHLAQFHNTTIAKVALGIMLLGLIIRIYAVTKLKKFYTRALLTTAQQALVKTGLYRIIRHPGYLGTILVWTFFGVAIQNYGVFFLSFPLMLITYGYRIKTEEKMLVAQFGQKYLDYRKTSWKLIPYIW